MLDPSNIVELSVQLIFLEGMKQPSSRLYQTWLQEASSCTTRPAAKEAEGGSAIPMKSAVAAQG